MTTMTALQPLTYRAPLRFTVVAAVAISALSALVAALLAYQLLALRGSTFVVASNSMQPAASRGDVVVVQPIDHVTIGDAVTFEKYGTLVTHRIVAKGRVPGTYETRGDANPGNDPWTITRKDIVGRAESVVPRLGWPVLLASQPLGRLGLFGVIATLLLALWWAVPRATRIPSRALHPSNGVRYP